MEKEQTLICGTFVFPAILVQQEKTISKICRTVEEAMLPEICRPKPIPHIQLLKYVWALIVVMAVTFAQKVFH